MLLLTFTVGANRYAVDVTRVVELVPRVELRSIPHAPACFAGLLGFRGKMVLVVELGLLLDVGPCQDCLSTRIILVDDSPGDQNRRLRDQEGSNEETREARTNPKVAQNLLGLVAEHVIDLTYVRPEQIIPAPVLLAQTPYLGPIIETDQGIVQLIVVEKVRDASLRSSQLERDTALDSIGETSKPTL
jgi:chemotaxis-related protein WspB